MSPVSVGTSRRIRTKKSQQTTLWLLTIGVNQYLDERLPNLRYSAVDCQDLSSVLRVTTTNFPQQNIAIYNDYAAEIPLRDAVIDSLHYITNNVQQQDTILFYFSGHGILHPDTNQAFLCLRDTSKDDLENTALAVSELLQMLSSSAAVQHLVWLDACHSGGMTLRGANIVEPSLNPSQQLVEVLQKNAAKSQDFYALLSCDRNQQSWEFPELGHGVFTYYLMQGLQGEAADTQGTISVDSLYRYVYYQTLHYIDKSNQQLRLINQQKRGRGDKQLHSEYPLQTPKRIVEGVGELILGNIPQVVESVSHKKALVVSGSNNSNKTLTLSKLLRGSAGFELEYLPRLGKDSTQDIREGIQECLLSKSEKSATVLLYLRGYLKETATGEINLVLRDDIWLSPSWLRQQFRRSGVSQQIIIFDVVTVSGSLQEWVEDLQVDSQTAQCIIAAQSTANSEQFVQALVDTLEQATNSTSGLSAAGWITKLQVVMAGVIPLQVWLSGEKGVIEIIRATTGKQQKLQTTALDLGICPYQGLRAFTENDAQYFYGRDSLTQQLINHLRQNSFLAVVGASGSGKSSVVRAGLIAQLRTGKQLPGSEKWLIVKMLPGDRPLSELTKIMEGEDNLQESWEGMQYLGVEGFVYWLRSRPQPMVMLVVDQFEELFTLAPIEDRNRFLELLLGALKYAGDKFKLVITLRADFITPCLEVNALAELLQDSNILVPPHLNDTEYRRVIINPAEQVGLKVESGLVEILLQELKNSAGDLPLLEFVLEQLWEHRQNGELTLFSYQKHLGGMAGALERKAQAVYDNLDKSAQQCARWIFLSLTQLGEGTEDTRRRANKSELIVKKYPAELVERTLQALTSAKLIVVNLEDGGSLEGVSRSDVETLNNNSLAEIKLAEIKQQVTIEVAHEILIRHWSTLRWWLSENRSRLRLQRQIEQAAQMWKNNDKLTDFLLQGVRLGEAEEIFVKYTDELSFEVQEFITACLDEKQRQQLEQKKRLRQAQTAVGIISVLGILATGFGGLAYFKQQDAQIGEIRALNKSSEALMLSHHQLEALIDSLRAGKQLKGLFAASEEIKLTTLTTLQQAVSQTREINRLQEHVEKVNAISFSPDGNFIASVGDDGNLILWHPNGKLITTIPNLSKERLTAVSFSPDSKLIAVGSADTNLKLYSINGKLIHTFTEHQNWLTSVSFSPDGKTIASASRDKTIKLWHIDGTLIKTWQAHQGWVNTIKFSPDGKRIISGGEDNLIKLWRNDGTLLKIFNGHQERITQIKFSQDGKLIVSASGDKTVKFWDNQGKLIYSFDDYPGQINSIAINSKNHLLAIAHSQEIEILTVDIKSLEKSRILQKIAHNGIHIQDINFSPDGEIIASATSDNSVRIWQIKKNYHLEDKSIKSIATNPQKSAKISFAAAGRDGKIYLKRRDNSLLKTLPGHKYPITAVHFSPDGKLLASASNDKTIKLWNIENYRLINTFKGHQKSVESISFNPNGKLLISGSADKTVKLWNLTGEIIQTFTGPQDTISSVTFSHNGKMIAAGSYDKQIYLWKLDGTLLNKFTEHKQAISSVQFSTDNKTLASASWDNYIKLWNITNDESFKTLTGHTTGVTSLSFNQDNKLLVSGSQNSTIKLWNLSNGNQLKTFSLDIGGINSLSFTPDNQNLVIGSENGGVRVWNLDVEQLLQQGCLKIGDYLKNNLKKNQLDAQLCNIYES